MRTRRSWHCLLAGVVLAAAADASDQHLVVLDNGLHVLARSQPDAVLATVEMFYGAGSSAEPDSLAGLAHLTEHLLAGDHGLVRRQALSTFDTAAITSPAIMAFWSEGLPQFLPEMLDIEAARMRGVVIDSLTFERERSVVLEELAFRADGHGQAGSQAAFRECYRGHPFGRPVGGTPESVAGITRDDIVAFIRAEIQPADAVLVVTGPIDPDSVVAMVRERFGMLDGRPTVAGLPAYPAIDAGQVILDAYDQSGFEVTVAFRAEVANARDIVLADLVVEYLKTAFFDADLTVVPGEVVIRYGWTSPYWSARFRARDVDPDRDVQSSLQWHWNVLTRLIRDLPARGDEKALSAWRKDWTDRRLRMVVPARTAAMSILAGIEPPGAADCAGLVAKLGPADIVAFIETVIDPGRMVLAVSHGQDSGRMARPVLADRVTRPHTIAAVDPLADLTEAEIAPVVAAYAESKILDISTGRLPNGIPVIYQRTPGADHLSIAGWRRFEPLKDARPGKNPGICRLYSIVASHHPRSNDRDDPYPEWPYHLSLSLYPYGSVVYAATGKTDEAREIVETMIERLDDDRLNLNVWAYLLDYGGVMLGRTARRAGSRARHWRQARIIGEEHPALASACPDPGLPDRLDYRDMQKLHGKAVRDKGRTTLIVSGGFDPDVVETLLAGSFGRRGRYEDWSPPPPPPGPAVIDGTVVAAMDRNDVVLTLTFPALDRNAGGDDLGVRFLLTKEAVDRALKSRLRMKEGWTYAVSFQLVAMAGWVLPEITVTCQPGQAPTILAVVRDELQRLSIEGLTADQIARARLDLMTLLLGSSRDESRLFDWVTLVVSFDGAPDAATREARDVQPLRPSVVVPPDRFVFSAVGAILEDDLELFFEALEVTD